jgi:hypothetical protein
MWQGLGQGHGQRQGHYGCGAGQGYWGGDAGQA